MTKIDNPAATTHFGTIPGPDPAVGRRFPNALPPGTLLGDYRILGVLGQGGFGITYSAEHTAIGKHVAIKEYFPQQFASRQGTFVQNSGGGDSLFGWGLGRFIEEAQRQANLPHPNIVEVNHFFEANGTAYIVLAYVPGTSMRHWIENLGRRPTQAELDDIVAPLLDAVAFVHSKNLLHRDIKPDNIMIRVDERTGKNIPVLLDFGAARAEIGTQLAKRNMTAIISDGYSPPEQYGTDAIDQGRWSDIYALGATFYHAVTGERPMGAFDRQRLKAGLSAASQSDAKNGYRRSFLGAIDWALEMEIARRPQSIEEWRKPLFAKTFTDVGKTDGGDNGSGGGGKSGTDGSTGNDNKGVNFLGDRSRMRLVAASAAVVLLGLGGMLAFAGRSPPEKSNTTISNTTNTSSEGLKLGNGGAEQKTDLGSGSGGNKVAVVEKERPGRIDAPKPIEVRLTTSQSAYKVGDVFSFTVEASRDCNFLVYTLSADDKVELHDPVTSRAFMGDPVLKAGERRQIPVPGAPGVARIKLPAGPYEIGAVCSREELNQLGLSGAQLQVPSRGGKRSFAFHVDTELARLKPDVIGRAAAKYSVTP